MPGRTETRTDPLFPKRGSPTCHGSSTDGPLPTEFLAGGTQASVPPQASPLPSGPPACAFLPPPVRSPRGRSCREGLESRGVLGAFSVPSRPLEVGFSAKGTVSGSWAVWGEAVPHWGASVGDQAPVLRIKQGHPPPHSPARHPSPMCPSFNALRGHDQCTMEPGKGEPRGRTPHVTPVLSYGWGR